MREPFYCWSEPRRAPPPRPRPDKAVSDAYFRNTQAIPWPEPVRQAPLNSARACPRCVDKVRSRDKAAYSMLGGLSTEVVAWYGAVVATVVFVWDIWKWQRRQARLRVSIRGGVCYPDGGVSKVEKTPYGEVQTLIPYYHIEVSNTGELPTTILDVQGTTKRLGLSDRIRSWRHKYVGVFGGGRFVAHQKSLPHLLGPGEVWSCRVTEDDILHLCQGGRRPKLEVTAACWHRPRLVRFPLRDKFGKFH